MLDTNSGLMGSSAAVALLAYGLVSAFWTGPLILGRQVEKSGWHAQCQSRVKARYQSSSSRLPNMSGMGCKGLMGGLFGQGANGLCDPRNPFGRMIDLGVSLADKELAAKRLQDELRANAAMSSCDCAVSQLEGERVSLGLYAGTARIVTPSHFRNINNSLNMALNSPACSLSSLIGGR